MRMSFYPVRCMPLVAILALLEGCAGHSAPPPVAETSPLTGKLSAGTIVSVRHVDPQNNQDVTEAILNALGVKQIPTADGRYVEIVIRKENGTGTSIVQAQLAGHALPVQGGKVAIVEAAETVIHAD
jgi:outer membrane lipoprotein SlyB